MNIGPFEWINAVADFIVYLLKEIFSIAVSVFAFVFHFTNKLFWYLLAAYPTGSKVVLALLAIFGVVLISYPRATIDLLGYIFLGRFFKDNSSKKVPFSAMLLVQPTPEESLMGREETSYTVAPMETEEFLVFSEDLDFVRSYMGEDFAKLKVEGQKKKFAECASKWKEFATTHKAILDFFHDLSYFPSAQELYFLEKHGYPLKDRWGNNVGVYTKNVPHVSRAKIDLAVKRMRILDRPNEFLRECHDVCIKGRKNAFGIWEGDHSFKHGIEILASRHGFLLEQSKIAAEPVKVEEPPFIPHGIPQKERFAHTLIIASSGWGKTQLMQAMAFYDMKEHASVVIVDSQGEEEGRFIDNVLHLRDKGELIYIDFTDPENVPSLSMFKKPESSGSAKEDDRIMNSMMEIYHYVFGQSCPI